MTREYNIMSSRWVTISFVALVLILMFSSCQAAMNSETPKSTNGNPTAEYQIHSPDLSKVSQDPYAQELIDSITSAGDYLVHYQLSSGELPYRVDLEDLNRSYDPSHLRLIAGTGSLYTTCRISGDPAYCKAGDQALAYYLGRLIEDPDSFDGLCLYSEGYCKIGGAALTIDTIYKRWQATSEEAQENVALKEVAEQLGHFILWLSKPEGGFYHRFNPYDGIVDQEYYVSYFNGESLLALLELHEMTGDEFWLQQALKVNTFMIKQPVKEDHWHAYGFNYLAKFDSFSDDDLLYATRIAQTIIENESNLEEEHSTISTATKVEALAAIATALQLQGYPYEWLLPAIKDHADFVLERQIPSDLCDWDGTIDVSRYEGGIIRSCDTPYLRVDTSQHWINGAAAYLELLNSTSELD